MMEEAIKTLVGHIHAAPHRFSLATTGGGAQALYWVQASTGASRSIIETACPYDSRALRHFLGHPPSFRKTTSPHVSRQLAACCFSRARMFGKPHERLIGVGCTASLITDRPRMGKHEAFVSTWNESQIYTYHVSLDKGSGRSRAAEEDIVSRALVNAIAVAVGVGHFKVDLGLTDGKDSLSVECVDVCQEVRRVSESDKGFFHLTCFGAVVSEKDEKSEFPAPNVLLSGSFNPLHGGHLELLAASCEALAASGRRQLVPALEMSVTNPDKQTEVEAEWAHRISQAAGSRFDVVVSNAPTFAEKAVVFPGVTFVVGVDTALRIVDPKYYGGEEKMQEALLVIKNNNCSFVVAGRVNEGEFLDAKEAVETMIPEAHRSLFFPIPFRNDISSTEIRAFTSQQVDLNATQPILARDFVLTATATGGVVIQKSPRRPRVGP
eukprot:TRINITY_DN4102_c0_g1_i1.p1 TRINITY_DN4102_c0_g1~~TRINITY_DN4102_c0_g1_i1.p1  ORF type:complete len:437 (+),score=56.95 TRINITY_DN4102_c0_g1_i1:58-1368(+)